MRASNILALVGILSIGVWNTDATCCYTFCGGRCGDCSNPTPLYCGNGPCNTFGCNCDGGCRTSAQCADQGGIKCILSPGSINYPVIACKNNNLWQCMITNSGRRRRSIPLITEDFSSMNVTGTIEHIFNIADINSDGKLSEAEAVTYLANNGVPAALAQAEISALDKSGDGFLSKIEIDPEYGQA